MLKNILVVLAASSIFYHSSLFADPATIRTVTGGQVQGKILSDWGSDQDLEVYKNIPYAAAPIGELRWRPPVAVESWEGVKTTDDYGPICPQTTELQGVLDTMIDGQGMSWWRTKLLKFLIGLAPEREISEDCLSINVWTPKDLEDDAKLPVMVWIHGGGHIAGSASDGIYEGDVLARKGVVVVSFNYRLGILGFMAHPQLSAEAETLHGHRSSGNYGTLDQIAALEWVGDNIAEFGGDPDKVTIFGESAGGHSVGQLMATPLARGLFHRAIAQSGLGSHNYMHLSKDMPGFSAAENGGVAIAAAGNIANDEHALKNLRELSAQQLLEIGASDVALVSYMHPNVDGWMLPQPVFEIFKQGQQADVPLLIGSNADEGTLFQIFPMPPLYWSLEVPETVDELKALLVAEFGEQDGTALMVHYQVNNDEEVPLARLNIWGDSYFGYQGIYGAQQMKNVDSAAYLYFFKRTPPSPKQTLGATHSSEISFVFGGGMPLFETNDFDEDLSEAMSTYWTNFAKAGLPIAKGLPAWPQFVENDPRQMIFEQGPVVGSIERSRLYSIYAKRIEQLQADVLSRLEAP